MGYGDVWGKEVYSFMYNISKNPHSLCDNNLLIATNAPVADTSCRCGE